MASSEASWCPAFFDVTAQLQKDLTKVPDAELKEHFATINRA
jgi:hypothetical protein